MRHRRLPGARAPLRHAGAGSARRAMAATLTHRGPDAHGVWSTPRPAWRSAIRGSPSSIFRRQARSRWCRAAARCVITYNGEIYNARRSPPRARGARAPLQGTFRHRGSRRGHRRMGRRARRSSGSSACSPLRVWDRRGPATEPRARPSRHQAALFGTAERARRFRLGAEGVRGAARLAAGAQPRCARRPICASLMCRRRIPSIAASTSSRRVTSPPSTPKGDRDLSLLELRGCGRARQERAARCRRPRGDRYARAAARRRGWTAARRRRAARRVPLRRHQFLGRRGDDADAQQRAGAGPIRSASRKRASTRRRMRERWPSISAPSTPSSMSRRRRREDVIPDLPDDL